MLFLRKTKDSKKSNIVHVMHHFLVKASYRWLLKAAFLLFWGHCFLEKEAVITTLTNHCML